MLRSPHAFDKFAQLISTIFLMGSAIHLITGEDISMTDPFNAAAAVISYRFKSNLE